MPMLLKGIVLLLYQSTDRSGTDGSSDQLCIAVQKSFANREPSTHDPKGTF